MAGGEASGRPELATLWWQAERLTATGRFEEALALAEQMRAEAIQSGEEDLAGLPQYYCGVVHHHNGNPQESEYHLDWVFAWLSPGRQARLRVSTGIDVLGTALAVSALNKWFLGYPEAALARSREAIASARAVGNLVGQAAATILSASLLFYLRVDEWAGVGSIAALSEDCHRLSRGTRHTHVACVRGSLAGLANGHARRRGRRQRAHATGDRRVADDGHRDRHGCLCGCVG